MSLENSITTNLKKSKKFKPVKDSYILKNIQGYTKIYLSNKSNDFVLIDNEDLYLLEKFSSISKHRNHYKLNRFVETEFGCLEESYYIHRLITKCTKQYSYGFNMEVDHKNRNTFDNRRDNLRFVTRHQNQSNIGPRSKTGYKGVVQRGNRYTAYASKNGKQVNLGSFETAEDAAREFDRHAKKIYGEFAYLNFPENDLKSE